VPIRWSAVEVSEAMDKAEAEFNKAQPYVQKIEDIAREARGIRNLPGYLDQDLVRVAYEVQNFLARCRSAINSVRSSIPAGAIETERQATKQGKTEKLI